MKPNDAPYSRVNTQRLALKRAASLRRHGVTLTLVNEDPAEWARQLGIPFVGDISSHPISLARSRATRPTRAAAASSPAFLDARAKDSRQK